jgi:hypothetical protein
MAAKIRYKRVLTMMTTSGKRFILQMPPKPRTIDMSPIRVRVAKPKEATDDNA